MSGASQQAEGHSAQSVLNKGSLMTQLARARHVNFAQGKQSAHPTQGQAECIHPLGGSHTILRKTSLSKNVGWHMLAQIFIFRTWPCVKPRRGTCRVSVPGIGANAAETLPWNLTRGPLEKKKSARRMPSKTESVV